MKKNYFKISFLLGFILLLSSAIFAQGTIEMTRNGLPTNTGFGTSITPMEVTYFNDAANNSTFTPNTPTLTMSISFRNQAFTGLNYGTGITAQTTGLVFGAGPTLASDPAPQGAVAYNRYNIIGQYGGNGGPTDPMFTTSSTAAPTPPSATPGGFGIKVAGTNATSNGGFELFTTAQVLFNSANGIGSRVYFGEVVMRFSRPVTNPVIHVAGLGGSYRFLPLGQIDIPANYKSIYFSSELELVNTGLSSTLMSGNQFIQLSGNNILNNNDVNPNGGSILDPLEVPFNNLGAATGSVRLNGTVQEVVYKVYLQSGTGSSAGFPWSALGIDPNTGLPLITGAVRNPFTGDIWYLGASMDKPTQQISGNIFVDTNGLRDLPLGDINKTNGIANGKTNIGGSLFANLLNTAGQVVASIPVTNDGAYLFNNVPVGTYSVQLTTNASSGTYASPATAPATVLPTGWANTGEFVGNTAGNDGTVNGNSSSVVVNAEDIKVEVNFGIEKLPESISYETFIDKPLLNSYLLLNGGIFNMPVLSGSDPEDQPIPAPLTNKALRIDTLPNNASLYYGGILVSVGQVIPNYTPSLLEVKFTNPGAGITGIVKFSYSYIDAAGLADPTPATYTIRWPAGGPLPIVLSDFGGIKNNCNVSLNWKTASELDSDRFEVEFSTTTNTTFEAIGTIGAAGNSTSTKSYQFNYAMESGVSYYFRLKMYKKDGTFTYSQIVPLSCVDTKASIAIVPNPTNIGTFRITGMAKGKNTVSIYSNDGKLIRTENVINNKDINISNLAAGTYVIRVLNENGTASVERLVKY
jgi:Secretion system C-terminal sorting domain